MRTKVVRPITESSAVFQFNNQYQIDALKVMTEGCLTLTDTCAYWVEVVNGFSEENFLRSVRAWCEAVAKSVPNVGFTCSASITNRLTGCFMYADVEFKGKYLYITERDGTVCLSETSPVCVDCGCKLKRVINNRRFECPNCEVVYISSAYIAEEDSEESGCHVFCFPKVYRIKV